MYSRSQVINNLVTGFHIPNSPTMILTTVKGFWDESRNGYNEMLRQKAIQTLDPLNTVIHIHTPRFINKSITEQNSAILL